MRSETNELELGKRIRDARLYAGLTQNDLSKLTNISTTQISAYENGKRNLGLYTLGKISIATGKSMDELYFGNIENYPITKSKNDGQLIINCCLSLFEKEVIDFKFYDNEYETPHYSLEFDKYYEIIFEFLTYIKKLKDDYSNFENPDNYKNEIIKMAVNKINERIKK